MFHQKHKAMKTLVTKFLILSMTALLLVGVWPATAQNNDSYIAISGVVKDSNSKETLPFSSITAVGSNVATVANSEGEFTIKIPLSDTAAFFEISHLGYVNRKFRAADIKPSDKIFYLDPYAVALQPVVIKPENGRSLILEALDKVKDNYSSQPNAMKAFYREYVRENRDYLSISEALVDIYKAPYTSGIDDDRVKIEKARKGTNIKKADTLAVKLEGGPKVMLMLDIVANPDVILSRESLEDYHLEVVDMVNIDNELNYVVQFTPTVILPYPLYIGKVYISKESKAITMLEFHMDLSDELKASQQFIRKKPMGLVFTPSVANYRVTYKLQDGKYYLNYVRSEIKFKCDWKKKWFKNNYTVVAEMAITDRSTNNVVKFPLKESFKSSDVFADKIGSFFEPDYWGANNTIEPEESIEAALKKFNRQAKRSQK